jgi:hypothetical protein
MDDVFFQHTSLDDAASQIRLLRLRNTGPDGSLSFDMRHYQLSALSPSENTPMPPCPSYIALSYTWGSLEKTHEVLIDGKLFAIAANCYYTLSQVVGLERYPAREQHYWIDQIAINQQNRDGKGEQAGNMGEIFRWGSMVFACTGPHAHNSKVVFDIINGLDMEAFDACRARHLVSRGVSSSDND